MTLSPGLSCVSSMSCNNVTYHFTCITQLLVCLPAEGLERSARFVWGAAPPPLQIVMPPVTTAVVPPTRPGRQPAAQVLSEQDYPVPVINLPNTGVVSLLDAAPLELDGSYSIGEVEMNHDFTNHSYLLQVQCQLFLSSLSDDKVANVVGCCSCCYCYCCCCFCSQWPGMSVQSAMPMGC
jgi:hypothetical protein